MGSLNVLRILLLAARSFDVIEGEEVSPCCRGQVRVLG